MVRENLHLLNAKVEVGSPKSMGNWHAYNRSVYLIDSLHYTILSLAKLFGMTIFSGGT